jgi:hypothetical protein
MLNITAIYRVLKQLVVYALTIGVLVSVTSCEKYLENSPEGDVEEDKLFNNENSFNHLLNGCYAKMKSENFVGGLTTIALPDILSDNVTYSTDNNGNLIRFYKWNYNSSTAEVENIWTSAYSIIQSCNEIIVRKDKFPASIAEDKKNSVLAQAYTIRAMVHFYLYRLFSDTKTDLSVPYITTLYPGQPERNTKSEVLQLCKQDLTNAADLNIISRDNIYLSDASVYFLKMQIALEEKEYAQVIVNADKVLAINSQVSSINDFNNMWITDNSPELIFRIHFTVADKPKNAWLLYDTRNNKDVWYADNSLIKLYNKSDIRLSRYFKVNDKGLYGIRKYSGRPSEDMPNGNDIKLMRVSEVYLSKAEALAHNVANKTEVLRILNIIRTNRGVAELKDSKDIMQEVKDERRREFAFEGMRFFDLKRWNSSVNRESSNTDNFLDQNSFKWSLPIPIGEIYANKNIKQNSGY